MNIFDVINATIGLYINLFWISFPLTIYLALEINKYAEGQTYIFVKLYRNFQKIKKDIIKEGGKTWKKIIEEKK